MQIGHKLLLPQNKVRVMECWLPSEKSKQLLVRQSHPDWRDVVGAGGDARGKALDIAWTAIVLAMVDRF